MLSIPTWWSPTGTAFIGFPLSAEGKNIQGQTNPWPYMRCHAIFYVKNLHEGSQGVERGTNRWMRQSSDLACSIPRNTNGSTKRGLVIASRHGVAEEGGQAGTLGRGIRASLSAA